MKKIFVSLIFFFCHLVSYAQTGSITGIQVTPRSDGSGLLDIYYNLSGSESSYSINLDVSFDGGSTYTSVPGNFLSGHIINVSPGSNRLIVWDGMGSFPNQYSTQTRLKISAESIVGSGSLLNGLISYWKLDEGSGEIAYDATGNANGILVDADIWNNSGKVNTCVKIYGQGRIILLPNKPINFISPYTFNAWVINNKHSAEREFFNFNATWTGNSGFQIGIYDENSFTVIHRDGGGWLSTQRRYIVDISDLADNVFIMLSVTHDGSGTNEGYRMYVNGVERYKTIVSSFGPFVEPRDVDEFSIGGRKELRYFQDKIDEPAVWNRALSPEEISLLFNNGKGFQYPFDQEVPDGQPCPGIPTVTDSRDGRVYNTVLIGEQCWLKENLDWLPSVHNSTDGSITSPRYYVSGYSGTSISDAKATVNYQNYGVLYNWPAATQACPTGWHLPSDVEWQQLELSLGMTQEQAVFIEGWRGIDEGGKLKSTSTSPEPHPRWDSPNAGATNQSGFKGYPGGDRYYSQGYFGLGSFGFFWTSTLESSPTPPTHIAWGRIIRADSPQIYRGNASFTRENGFSVRCIKTE